MISKSVPSQRWAPITAAGLVVAVGLLLYYRWDNWWVNWDGGSYLYLARSLAEGQGLVFPDGSAALNRGPGYPLVLAAGLALGETSARTAIWVSRAVLIAAGGLTAYLVSRHSRGMVAAVLAGLAATLPALVLESGGWFFVPDGLVALLVLAAIGVVVLGQSESWAARAALAGVLLAVAVMTKESAALYSPVLPLVLWSRDGEITSRVSRAVGAYLIALASFLLLWASATALWGDDRLIPWSLALVVPVLAVLVVAGLALVVVLPGDGRGSGPAWEVGLYAGLLLVPVSAGLLWALGNPVVRSPWAGLLTTLDSLDHFFGWAWVPALVLLVAGVIVGRRLDRPELWMGGVLLVGVGLGQAVYSGAAQLSMRNAVGGLIGLAILIGVFVQDQARRPGVGRWLAYGLAISFLVLAALVTERIEESPRAENATWDNPAVLELRQWLESAAARTVAVMPMYASYVWFLGGDLPEPELVDVRFAPAGRASYQLEDFCQMIWWAGAMRECPQDSELAVAKGNRRVVSVIFDAALRDVAGVVVVTGNLETPSAHDGSELLYLIEEHGLGTRLFATSEEHLPHWAVAYQMSDSPEEAPAVVQEGLAGIDPLAETVVSLDTKEFEGLLRRLLP